MNLKYEYLFNPSTLQAMRKLMGCTDFDVKLAYRIAKIAAAMDREMQTAKPLMDGIHAKYSEEPETFKTQRAELFEITTPLPFDPIPMDALTTAKLTPQEILGIEWALEV